MKISKLPAAVYVLFSASLFLITGWLIYPWLLGVIISGSDVALVQLSVDSLIINRFWAALSFMLLGAVTSGCFMFFRRKITTYATLGTMVGLILLAFGSVAGWIFYLRYRFNFIFHSFTIEELSIKSALAIEDVPVHEAGMFASIVVFAVFLVVLLFVVWTIRKRRPL